MCSSDSSFCAHGEKGRAISLIFSYIPSCGPTLTTSSKLNYFPKTPSLNLISLRVRASTYEFGVTIQSSNSCLVYRVTDVTLTHILGLFWPCFLGAPWLRLTYLVTLDLSLANILFHSCTHVAQMICSGSSLISQLGTPNSLNDKSLRFPIAFSTGPSTYWRLNHSFLIALPAFYNWGRICQLLRNILSVIFRNLLAMDLFCTKMFLVTLEHYLFKVQNWWP